MPLDDTLGYQTCANCGLETGLGDVGGGIASDSGELLRICMLAAA